GAADTGAARLVAHLRGDRGRPAPAGPASWLVGARRRGAENPGAGRTDQPLVNELIGFCRLSLCEDCANFTRNSLPPTKLFLSYSPAGVWSLSQPSPLRLSAVTLHPFLVSERFP